MGLFVEVVTFDTKAQRQAAQIKGRQIALRRVAFIQQCLNMSGKLVASAVSLPEMVFQRAVLPPAKCRPVAIKNGFIEQRYQRINRGINMLLKGRAQFTGQASAIIGDSLITVVES